MGALTLAIVVPAGPSMPAGKDKGRGRATSASSFSDLEAHSATDLREAARTLGLASEIVVVPAHSDETEFALRPVADLMRSRLASFDRVLIAAHANLGGSGRLHATARACGLSVVGPEGLAIGRAYDKLLSRQVLRRHNIPVPRTVALDPSRRAPTIELDRLGWPGVVKPRRGSASVGVQRINSAAELATITSTGDEDLIVEREVRGRELSVVILDGRVLGIAELDRSFSDDGLPQTHAMICPAELDARREAGLSNLALRASASLQLGQPGAGPVRVDLLVSERDNEVVLEVEPLPPLHRDGIVARVARAAGLSYPHLCAQLLATPARRQTSAARSRV